MGMEKNWTLSWSDKDGKHHTVTLAATTGREAQRKLYERLGVKRIIGINIQATDDA